MYDRQRIIQKNEHIRTLITNNLVPRAFPKENGRGKKKPGNEFGWEASSYQEVLNPKFLPLSSTCTEASTGYSSQKKKQQSKKQKARVGRWEEGKGRSSLLSFPFPSFRALSLSPPQTPTTQRGLRGERVLTRVSKRQRPD